MAVLMALFKLPNEMRIMHSISFSKSLLNGFIFTVALGKYFPSVFLANVVP